MKQSDYMLTSSNPSVPVIRFFADKATKRLSRRESVPAVDPRICRIALRKLRLLDSALSLEELCVPPGIGLSVLRAIDLVSTASGSMKLIQGVVLKAWSESAAVMVCSNVCRGWR